MNSFDNFGGFAFDNNAANNNAAVNFDGFNDFSQGNQDDELRRRSTI